MHSDCHDTNVSKMLQIKFSKGQRNENIAIKMVQKKQMSENVAKRQMGEKAKVEHNRRCSFAPSQGKICSKKYIFGLFKHIFTSF